MASSITRALTKRINKSQPEQTGPDRGQSHKRAIIDRNQISLPIELLSATNSLAFDAPDLPRSLSPMSAGMISSDASSTRSYGDSIRTPTLSSPSSLTSADFSREASPIAVEPSQQAMYFDKHEKVGSLADRGRRRQMSGDSGAPSVPTRAPSHTKSTHQALAHKRSVSGTRNQAQAGVVRSSVDMFRLDADHPFGAELAQVSELAEEFRATDVRVWDEEEQYLSSHGLQRFAAADYAQEIKGLYGRAFSDQQTRMDGGWV